MKANYFKLFSIAVFAIATWSSSTLADVPLQVRMDGYLTDNTNAAITGATTFNIRVYDENNNCLMYSEQHSIAVNNGEFALSLGAGTSQVVNHGSNFKEVFDNNVGGPCTLGANEKRRIEMDVTVTSGAWSGFTDSGLAGPMIHAVPYSMFASNAEVAQSLAADLPLTGLDFTGCGNGEVITYNGTDFGCQPIPASADGQIDNSELGPLAVQNGNLGTDAVTSDKILNGTIVDADINDVAFGKLTGFPCTGTDVLVSDGSGGFTCSPQSSPTLGTDAVNLTHMNDNSVGANEIINGSITSAEIETSFLNSLQDRNVSNLNNDICGANGILKRDGSDAAWECVTVDTIETDPSITITNPDYVARWNGSSLIDSSIFDDGNIVSIQPLSGTYIMGLASDPGALTQDNQFGIYNDGANFYLRGRTSGSSDVNVQLGGSGGLTVPGSSTNILMKSDGSVLANSSIFDDGTSVGVHNSSPSVEFDVTGSGNFSGNLDVAGNFVVGSSEFVVNPGGSVGIGGSPGGGYGLEIFTDTYMNDALQIGAVAAPGLLLDVRGDAIVTHDLTVGNSDLFVDESLNSVGIGTNTPIATLDVNGDAIFRGHTTIEGAYVLRLGYLTNADETTPVNGTMWYNTDTNKLRVVQNGTTYDLDAIGGPPSAAGSNGEIQFNSSNSLGSDTSFVYSGGRLGIGSSTPGYELDIPSGGARIGNYASVEGDVSVGTLTRNEALTVNGALSIGEMTAPTADVANYGILYVDSGDSSLKFRDDSGAVTDLTFGANLGGFPVPTLPGTVQRLEWDGSAWQLVAPSSSGITNSSLTPNNVPKVLDASGNLQASNISDDGTTVTLGSSATDVTGTLDVTGNATFNGSVGILPGGVLNLGTLTDAEEGSASAGDIWIDAEDSRLKGFVDGVVQAIPSQNYVDGNLAGNTLTAPGAPQTGQYLQWTGTSWTYNTPSGGLSGTGTDDQLAKFTSGGTALGDSSISDNGSTVSMSGNLSVTGTLDMQNSTINNVATPAAGTDAVNQNYADGNLLGSALSAPSGGQVNQSIRWNAAGTAWEYYTPLATETDPSVGPLTIGYVPRWNVAGNALEDSNLFSNANGVGINTNTPSGALDIYQGGADASMIRLQGSESNGGNFRIEQEGDIYSEVNAAFADAPANMTLSRVGGSVTPSGIIGKKAAAGMNDVTASEDLFAIEAQGFYNLQHRVSSQIAMSRDPNGLTPGTHMPGLIEFRTADDFTAPVARMTINSVGNVGIGSASPDFKLDVVGGAAVLPLPGSSPNTLNLDNSQYSIYHDGSDFYIMGKDSGGTDISPVAINSGGVTTAAGAGKEIQFNDGSNNFSSSPRYYIDDTSYSPKLLTRLDNGVLFTHADGSDGGGTNDDIPGVVIKKSSSDISFSPKLEFERSFGNIGSESPVTGDGTGLLQILGLAQNGPDPMNDIQDVGGIEMYVDGVPTGGPIYQIPSRMVFKTSDSSGGVVERMRISSNGNIGIRTSNPVATLDMGFATDAMILPKGTTGQQPTPPVGGMVRYNTDNSEVEAYNGTVWVGLGSGGGGVTSSGTSGNIAMFNSPSDIQDSPLSANGSDVMLDNGYLGIGSSTAPAARLEVFEPGASGDNQIVVSYRQDLTPFHQMDSSGDSYFTGKMTIGSNTFLDSADNTDPDLRIRGTAKGSPNNPILLVQSNILSTSMMYTDAGEMRLFDGGFFRGGIRADTGGGTQYYNGSGWQDIGGITQINNDTTSNQVFQMQIVADNGAVGSISSPTVSSPGTGTHTFQFPMASDPDTSFGGLVTNTDYSNWNAKPNNGAAANSIPRSDGTNFVDSGMTSDGTNVTVSNNLTVAGTSTFTGQLNANDQVRLPAGDNNGASFNESNPQIVASGIWDVGLLMDTDNMVDIRERGLLIGVGGQRSASFGNNYAVFRSRDSVGYAGRPLQNEEYTIRIKDDSDGSNQQSGIYVRYQDRYGELHEKELGGNPSFTVSQVEPFNVSGGRCDEDYWNGTISIFSYASRRLNTVDYDQDNLTTGTFDAEGRVTIKVPGFYRCEARASAYGVDWNFLSIYGGTSEKHGPVVLANYDFEGGPWGRNEATINAVIETTTPNQVIELRHSCEEAGSPDDLGDAGTVIPNISSNPTKVYASMTCTLLKRN